MPRDWRLIARTLKILKDHGMTEAALIVDAENLSGALHLYQKMGFKIENRSGFYRKPLNQLRRYLSRQLTVSDDRSSIDVERCLAHCCNHAKRWIVFSADILVVSDSYLDSSFNDVVHQIAVLCLGVQSNLQKAYFVLVSWSIFELLDIGSKFFFAVIDVSFPSLNFHSMPSMLRPICRTGWSKITFPLPLVSTMAINTDPAGNVASKDPFATSFFVNHAIVNVDGLLSSSKVRSVPFGAVSRTMCAFSSIVEILWPILPIFFKKKAA